MLPQSSRDRSGVAKAPAHRASPQAELRIALSHCSLRGLKHSAEWCAELLVGLPDEDAAGDRVGACDDLSAYPALSTLSNSFLVAKSYFDLGEYERCATLLDRAQMDRLVPDVDSFLRLYAWYLAGDKRRAEAEREKTSASEVVRNERLPRIIKEITLRYPQRHLDPRADPFHLWLLGVCLRERGGHAAGAVDALLASLKLFPCNWSCWLDLESACNGFEVNGGVPALKLPDETHFAARFFRAHTHHGAVAPELEVSQSAAPNEALLSEFPESPFALAGIAMAKYTANEFDSSHEWFLQLQEADPCRLTNVDTLSNVLFVKEAHTDLSRLAHKVSKLDKFRVESCIVVGNYYSLKGMRERAVVYFKRALRQNPAYLPAMTLLGHEYIELKNLPAAIQAYRSAVDVDPRDYRAWYGLGQTYEIARMHLYSLHYYRKAALLRPKDSRMWSALGGAYENNDQICEAIVCYERAEQHDDREGVAVQRLAHLYKSTGAETTAATYFHMLLKRRLDEGPGNLSGPEVTEALRFLATFMRNAEKLEEAQHYAEQLQRIAGPADREAEALLREIQSMRGAR